MTWNLSSTKKLLELICESKKIEEQTQYCSRANIKITRLVCHVRTYCRNWCSLTTTSFMIGVHTVKSALFWTSDSIEGAALSSTAGDHMLAPTDSHSRASRGKTTCYHPKSNYRKHDDDWCPQGYVLIQEDGITVTVR